jgi:hypothetical protein
MVNEQPEALRLAAHAEANSNFGYMKSIAAELRRLHEINSKLCRKANTLTILSARDADKITALEAINQELLAALKEANACVLGDHWGNALDVLGAAINKAERTTT